MWATSHYLAATISTPHLTFGGLTDFLLGVVAGFIVHGRWGHG